MKNPETDDYKKIMSALTYAVVENIIRCYLILMGYTDLDVRYDYDEINDVFKVDILSEYGIGDDVGARTAVKEIVDEIKRRTKSEIYIDVVDRGHTPVYPEIVGEGK